MSRKRQRLSIFFLDIYENDDYLQTDNEAEAFARFYACQFSCVLWMNGKIVAEKDWVEMEVEDSYLSMSAEVYAEGEHADLEEVELV